MTFRERQSAFIRPPTTGPTGVCSCGCMGMRVLGQECWGWYCCVVHVVRNGFERRVLVSFCVCVGVCGVLCGLLVVS